MGSCHSGLYRDLPAIAAAPTDGGTTPVDGATGEPDAGPNLDAGPKPDASPNLDAGTTVVANPCQGRTGTASNVTLSDGTAVSCDGEWALVLKAAAASKEFAYDGGCWDPQHTQSSGCSVDTPFETAAAPEGRFPAYSRVLGTQIRIVMSDGNDRAFGSREFVYAAGATTLGAAVMAGTYTSASPIDPWNYMTSAGSKLHSVLTEGVNVGTGAYAQVRLGIVAAPSANDSPGSWLGVGGQAREQMWGGDNDDHRRQWLRRHLHGADVEQRRVGRCGRVGLCEIGGQRSASFRSVSTWKTRAAGTKKVAMKV